MTIQTVKVDALPVTTFADLPPMYRREVKLLDERELCPKVNTVAHGGDWPADPELFACDAWAAGGCRRAGALVACAFVDNGFQWEKAADWQRQPDGALMYQPQKQTKGHKTR